MYAVQRSPVGGVKVFLRGKTATMLLELAPVWKCLLKLNPLCALAGPRAPRSTCRDYRALSCGAPILFIWRLSAGLGRDLCLQLRAGWESRSHRLWLNDLLCLPGQMLLGIHA